MRIFTRTDGVFILCRPARVLSAAPTPARAAPPSESSAGAAAQPLAVVGAARPAEAGPAAARRTGGADPWAIALTAGMQAVHLYLEGERAAERDVHDAVLAQQERVVDRLLQERASTGEKRQGLFMQMAAQVMQGAAAAGGHTGRSWGQVVAGAGTSQGPRLSQIEAVDQMETVDLVTPESVSQPEPASPADGIAPDAPVVSLGGAAPVVQPAASGPSRVEGTGTVSPMAVGDVLHPFTGPALARLMDALHIPMPAEVRSGGRAKAGVPTRLLLSSLRNAWHPSQEVYERVKALVDKEDMDGFGDYSAPWRSDDTLVRLVTGPPLVAVRQPASAPAVRACLFLSIHTHCLLFL